MRGKVTYNFKHGDKVVACTRRDGPFMVGHIKGQDILCGSPCYVVSVDYPTRIAGISLKYKMDDLLGVLYTRKSATTPFLLPRLATEEDIDKVRKIEAVEDLGAIVKDIKKSTATYSDVVELTKIIKEFLALRGGTNE